MLPGMKRFALVLLVLATSIPARAEVFNTARTLLPGAFSAGLEYAPSPSSLSLYVGAGLVRRFDLGVRLGVDPTAPLLLAYYGADLELAAIEDGPGRLGLSIALGAHATGSGGRFADATLLASKLLLDRLEPYAALDLDWSLAESRGLLRAVGGVEVIVVPHRLDVVLEGGLGLAGTAPHAVSAGFLLYL